MDELDLTGVFRPSDGEEQLWSDHTSPTNDLDLTGIAYDFPEEAANGAEIAPIMANLDEPMPDLNSVSLEDNDIQVEEGLFAQMASLEDLMMVTQEPAEDWPRGAEAESLIAMNEAYTELLTCFIHKVELAITANRESQTRTSNRIQALRDAGELKKKKVPVLLYLPPYFKDQNMMSAPQSSEAKVKQRITDYDPLMKEEKKWSKTEIQMLNKAVRENLIRIYMEPFLRRKQRLLDQIKGAGQDVPKMEISIWKDEIEGLNRKNDFVKEMPLEALLAAADTKEIDWTTISNINFNGMRTAQALELKWTNEVSPRWNNHPWTEDETRKLKKLREENKFVSWAVLADRLGSRRSPWSCFSKYKRDIYQQSKEWTQAEDEKLIALCSMMQMNGNINWDKVTYYMPGRNRQQVRVRFMRTLDKNVKHGKWSEQEDLLLMCAVNRLGAQDWSKIAKAVTGRTDTQCRERWVNVLDRRVHPKEWSQEEDEKLVYLKGAFSINEFGPTNWSKCAPFLTGRTADQCRYRYLSLVNSKIRLCTAKNISAKDFSSAEGNSLKKSVQNVMDTMEEPEDTMDEPEDDGGVDPVHLDYRKMYDSMFDTKDQEEQEPRSTVAVKADVANTMAIIEQKHKEGKGMDDAAILKAVKVKESDVNNFKKKRERHNAFIALVEQEEEDKKIDFGGLRDAILQNPDAPGPSTVTPVQQAQLQEPKRNRRNIGPAKSLKPTFPRSSDKKKPITLMDHDEKMTPARPVRAASVAGCLRTPQESSTAKFKKRLTPMDHDKKITPARPIRAASVAGCLRTPQESSTAKSKKATVARASDEKKITPARSIRAARRSALGATDEPKKMMRKE